MAILTSISGALEDPSVGQHHPSRKSQIFYDNMPTSPAGAYSSSSHTSNAHSSSTHSTVHTTRSTPYLDTSPTEALRDMLRQCGESEEDLHAFAARAMRDNTRETESAPPSLLLSPQKSKEDLDEFSALYASSSMTSSMSSSAYGAGRAEVADVSVSSQHCINHESVNETWSQIVSAADNNVNGDYIDLIPFMDEEGQNSSLEMECPTTNGSQISISQLSTVASSGYQSFGYSQSSSPVEPGSSNTGETTREVTRSPVIHYPMQPLSFSNPLYRHQQLSQHQLRHHQHHRPQHYSHHPQHTAQEPLRTKDDSSGSLSSGDEVSTVKQSSPVRSDRGKSASSSIDPLRKLSQLSSSSDSNESLNDHSYLGAQQDKTAAVSGGAGGGGEGGVAGGVRFSLGPRGTSPAQAQSSPRVERTNSHGPPPEVPPRPDRLLTKLSALPAASDSETPPVVPPRPERTSSYCDPSSSEQRNLGMRPYHLSHSMDFGCLQRQQADQLRRTATDSVIAKTSTPVHMNSGSSSSSQMFSREDSFSSVHSSQSHGSLNSRRLSPQSQVHMGISSVQRKLQEQERTKQEVRRTVISLDIFLTQVTAMTIIRWQKCFFKICQSP